jgi:tellurite methyltransferase
VAVERSIVGFHCDTEGDWVAELDCGHNQHVRHRPPFQLRPWVIEEEGRAAHLRSLLDCLLCDRTELPAGLQFARRSAEWDTRSLPTGLRRFHKLADGTWGHLVVEEGRLAFRARTSPPIDRTLGTGDTQAIPPGVEHEVEPAAGARLFIEFLAVVPFEERGGIDPVAGGQTAMQPGRGGDPACWSHLVCPECGNLSGNHHQGCAAGGNVL